MRFHCVHTPFTCVVFFLLTLQNWWSATGHAEYYRTWNVPVYDFLYSYVYQELFQVIEQQSLVVVCYNLLRLNPVRSLNRIVV